MAKASATSVEPFDRLEDKVKLLVTTIARLKSEHTRLTEENGRLQRELAGLQDRVQSAEHAGSELAALRQERDVIRSRVGEMLAELDTLNL